MPINPTTFAMPQSFIGNVNFSQLANLGKVYGDARAQARRSATLASLGNNPTQDALTLIRSGDSGLAQLGLSLRNKLLGDAEAKRQFDLGYGLNVNADKRAANADVRASRADLRAEEAARRTNMMPEEKLVEGTAAADRLGLTGDKRTQFIASFTGGSYTPPTYSTTPIQGVNPDTGQQDQFVLSNTGEAKKVDLSPGFIVVKEPTAQDRELIKEADDKIAAGKNVDEALTRSLNLSKSAFYGPTAQKRGEYASLLGPSSEMGKSGIATQLLRNEVMLNALTQLRTIFGGNPTEGERQVLIDIQGSVDQPPAVRDEIFRRAQRLAKEAVQRETIRTQGLRSGQYFKPGFDQRFSAARPSQPQEQSFEETRTLNGVTYGRRGKDWFITNAQ